LRPFYKLSPEVQNCLPDIGGACYKSAMLLRRGHDISRLMWPAHYLFEAKVQKKRSAFLERLPASAEPVPAPSAP